MTRTKAFWLASWLAVLGYAPLLHAQTAGTGGTSVGSMTALLTYIGDHPYTYTTDVTLKRPISKADCEANVKLKITLNNIPSGFKLLDAWIGTNCSPGTRTTRVGELPCEQLVSETLQTGRNMWVDYEVPVEKICSKEADRVIWFLPLNSTEGSDATIFAQVPITVDKVGPSPAANVVGGAGETEIPLSWTAATDDTLLYKILIDPDVDEESTGGGSGEGAGSGQGAGAGDVDSGTTTTSTTDAGTKTTTDAGTKTSTSGVTNSECPSKWLIEGAEFDPKTLPKSIKVIPSDKKISHYTLSGSDVGSKRAAVAVVAQDLAENSAVMSNIACVKVVPTSGFWDKYRAAGGDAEVGCACSAPGKRRAQSDVSALCGLLALGGILAVRRRLRRAA